MQRARGFLRTSRGGSALDNESERITVKMSWGVWFQECETTWQKDRAGPDKLVKQASGPHVYSWK